MSLRFPVYAAIVITLEAYLAYNSYSSLVLSQVYTNCNEYLVCKMKVCTFTLYKDGEGLKLEHVDRPLLILARLSSST